MKVVVFLLFILQLVFAQTNYVNDTNNQIVGKIVYKIATASVTTGNVTAEDIRKTYGYYMKEGTGDNCANEKDANITVYVLNTCINNDTSSSYKYTRTGDIINKTTYSKAECSGDASTVQYTNNNCIEKAKAYIEPEPKYLKDTTNQIVGKIVYNIATDGNMTAEQIKTKHGNDNNNDNTI